MKGTVDDETEMNLVNSGYLIGEFVPDLRYIIKEASISQEGTTYCKLLSPILRTFGFGAGDVLKPILF